MSLASTALAAPATPADKRAFDAQVEQWEDDLALALAQSKLAGPAGERARAAVPMIRVQLEDAARVYDSAPWPRWRYQYVGNIVHRADCPAMRKSHRLVKHSGTADAVTVLADVPGSNPCPRCCPAEHAAAEAKARAAAAAVEAAAREAAAREAAARDAARPEQVVVQPYVSPWAPSNLNSRFD